MGVDEVIRSKRGDILRIAARHGVTEIHVFGSVARGDARPDSDVDFLVRVGPSHSRFFPGGLVMDLEELLGRRVDVVEAEGLRAPVRDRVLSEAVPV